MSALPLWVDWPHHDALISANAFVEVDVLIEQIHNESARDTALFLVLFVAGLADERDRWHAARGRGDHAAEAEAASEMRDLTALAGACRDHLRGVQI